MLKDYYSENVNTHIQIFGESTKYKVLYLIFNIKENKINKN